MISKKMLIAVGAVTVAAGAFGVAQVSAASNPAQGSLAQRLATTFHLDQSKVQGVIDQNRADHQAQAETNYENMLQKAVTAGKITSDQKTAILAEHNKLKGELQAAMQQTGTARRTALGNIRTEAQNWAKQNNLPAGWLLGMRPLRGMGPMNGHGLGHMKGNPGNDSDDNGNLPSPSTSPLPSPSPNGSPSPSA